MEKSLFELVEEAKNKNGDAMEEIIKMFEPKLNKSALMVNRCERDDLSQELKIRLMNIVESYDLDSVPSFWEMEHPFKYLS